MEIVSQSTVTDSNSPKTLTVSCPAGKRVVGGGAVNSSPPVGAALPISAPVADGSGWTATARAGAAPPWSLTVRAICARVQAAAAQ